jgi:hypothetical protein
MRRWLVGCALSALVAAVITAGVDVLRAPPDRSWRTHRMDRECDYVRLVVNDWRNDLISGNAQRVALVLLEIQRFEFNDWHEANLCTPEDFVAEGRAAMGGEPLPAVLHELDWVLAWVR